MKLSKPNLPLRVAVRIKWKRGEPCATAVSALNELQNKKYTKTDFSAVIKTYLASQHRKKINVHVILHKKQFTKIYI